MDLQATINELQGKILERKAYLVATDYYAIKKAEGYEIGHDILEKRALIRLEINQLEQELIEAEKEELAVIFTDFEEVQNVGD